MSIISWDGVGTRFSESGVSKGVLYVKGETGVPWNGLVSISENPEGAEEIELWADNMKYGSFLSFEKYSATIEAYTYPEEFSECDGSKALAKGIKLLQQKRKRFDLCYRTEINRDDHVSYGYKLHLVYNALASPSSKTHKSLSITPDIQPFSWDISTNPFILEDNGMSSTIEIDSTQVDKIKLDELEKILYGTEDSDPRMPDPEEVAGIIKRLDVERLFLNILNSHNHWIWDSFEFSTDRISDAIEKESKRHMFYDPEPGTTYIQPSIAYKLISDTDGVRNYSVIIIDQNNPSQLAIDAATELGMTSIGTTHSGDFYYYQYTLTV